MPIISNYTEVEKDIFIDENGKYFYKGSGLVTGGAGGTLNKRKNLGYTIYYNPITYDKIGVADYDISLAEYSNDENKVYSDRQDLIQKGYIKIRPPKEGNLLGRWTWSVNKFNTEKDKILITENHSVCQKVFVDKKDVKQKNGKLYVKIKGRTKNTKSILKFPTSVGTTTLSSLLKAKYFDNPKNNFLIEYLIKLIDSKSFICLDFFSGSATTAHVVMQLNAEDGGNRKFIMVQLPEKTDEKSEAYKAGYKNICEIGEERIRRAAKKIHEDKPDAKFDDGFRVFKVDSSNMNDVYYTPADLDQSVLADTIENIKPDRNDLDLMFGCLVDWGVPLSLPYKSENIDGCTVHTYNDGDLVACFDKNIPESVVREIAKRQPLRVVFRDDSFETSPEKLNVDEIFKDMSPDTRVRVI